jgi:hypothetical protein
MKPEPLLEALEAAAETLSVKVSYEPLQSSVGHGGLCRVKNAWRVIIDRRATVQERIATLGQALARVDHHSAFTLPPKIREILDYYDTRRAS